MLFNRVSSAIAAVAATTAHAAACPRDALLDVAAQYRTALEMGWAGALESLAYNFSNVENGKPVEITAGILFSGLTRIDHNRTTADEAACVAFAEIVATDYRRTTRYVLGTQLRLDPADLSLVGLDAVVSTNGSLLFNATQTLLYLEREDWGPLPAAEKTSSREALQAIADAYLDQLGANANTTAPTNGTAGSSPSPSAVLWDGPCEQLDGSRYGACNRESPATSPAAVPMVERRYVIDETLGSVSVIGIRPALGRAADSHEFRIEGGKLRYVHSIVALNTTKLSTDPSRQTSRVVAGVTLASL